MLAAEVTKDGNNAALFPFRAQSEEHFRNVRRLVSGGARRLVPSIDDARFATIAVPCSLHRQITQ